MIASKSDPIAEFRMKIPNARLFPTRKCVIGDKKSKRPLHAGWRTREYTDEELRQLLRDGHGLAWAIDRDYVVVDVDKATKERPNKVGNISFERLRNDIDLPTTLTVESPTGGRHYYFFKRQDVEIRKSLEDYPDIEFLAYGSYVLVPGSPHWQEGEYRFGDPNENIEYSSELETALQRIVLQRDKPKDERVSQKDAFFLLSLLDPRKFSDYVSWISLMAAFHDATGGSGEGREYFIEWSQQDPEFPDEAEVIGHKWDTFQVGKAGGATVGTLFKLARDAKPEEFKKWNLDRLFGVEVDGRLFTSAFELRQTGEGYRPIVIDQILREGEVMNVVAATKVGKSWFSMGLAQSIVAGLPWLNQFETARGNVLIIDNELHAETARERERIISKSYADDLHAKLYFKLVRGRGWTLETVAEFLKRVTAKHGPGFFKLVLLDALYRFQPRGNDENQNGLAKDIYNDLDAIADVTKSAIATVLHSPKGDMSVRDVRDLAAGAGAQARAADTQIGIRPHAHGEDMFVLEVINRSFPNVEPITIRRSPDMTFAIETDVEAVRADKTTGASRAKDEECKREILGLLQTTELSARGLEDRLRFGRTVVRRNIQSMLVAGEIRVARKEARGGHDCEIYTAPTSSAAA